MISTPPDLQKKYTRTHAAHPYRWKMEEHIPPHHLAVPDSDSLDMAQLGPTTQLSELIELACRCSVCPVKRRVFAEFFFEAFRFFV